MTENRLIQLVTKAGLTVYVYLSFLENTNQQRGNYFDALLGSKQKWSEDSISEKSFYHVTVEMK